MRPVVAFGAAGAGADVGADADADDRMSASDDDGENNGADSLGVAPPEGETPPRGDLLCRLPRSAGTSQSESRAAV